MRRIKVVQLYPGCDDLKLGDILHYVENEDAWYVDTESLDEDSWRTNEFIEQWPSFFEEIPSPEQQIKNELDMCVQWAMDDLKQLLSSGAVFIVEDITVEQIKQIICALLEKRVDCYMPGLHSQAAASRRWRKEINNLRKFI